MTRTPMSSAVILQHVPYLAPGRIIPLFRDFGIPIDIRRLDRGDEVPGDLDEVRVLIVLGGPMAVRDVGSERYPFLAKEVEVLKRLVAADRPVLGIELGAQLLAHAAGAKVHPNVVPGSTPEQPATPAPEFGWGAVTFPFPGGTEPIVFGLHDGIEMFHWHEETFDLPKLPAPANTTAAGPPPPTGSVLLSSSRLCKNQAFRFKTRLFGFQYHFELDEAGLEQLLANDTATLQRVGGADLAERIRAETKRVYPLHARMGNRILENFVQFLKAY